jgi:hypothetical protein
MSLVRLLASGKSLVGLNNGASPYRVRRQTALPRFGSDKNPFCHAEDGGTAKSQDASNSHSPTVLGVHALACLPAADTLKGGSQTPDAPDTLKGGHPTCPSPAAPAAAGYRRLGWRLRAAFAGLAPKVIALVCWPRSRPAKPAVRPSPEAPVQAELALDRVRVVRNDLHDTDLEIVAAAGGAHGATGAAATDLAPTPGRASAPPMAPAETARLRARATVRLLSALKS